jgi:hypothetical protein
LKFPYTNTVIGTTTIPRPEVFPINRIADERTRTAVLTSLRVIIHALQGFAQPCKSLISKGFSFLRIALCCTVLRSRWYQSGIRSPWNTRRRYPLNMSVALALRRSAWETWRCTRRTASAAAYSYLRSQGLRKGFSTAAIRFDKHLDRTLLLAQEADHLLVVVEPLDGMGQQPP